MRHPLARVGQKVDLADTMDSHESANLSVSQVRDTHSLAQVFSHSCGFSPRTQSWEDDLQISLKWIIRQLDGVVGNCRVAVHEATKDVGKVGAKEVEGFVDHIG